jgi:hypothetical protein
MLLLRLIVIVLMIVFFVVVVAAVSAFSTGAIDATCLQLIVRLFFAIGGPMPLYLVSYDIKEENRDEYQELWDYLDALGGVRILFSEYAVPFNDGGAFDLATKINKHLKTGDRLLVCELFDGESQTRAWVRLRIGDDAFQEMLTNYARTLN